MLWFIFLFYVVFITMLCHMSLMVFVCPLIYKTDSSNICIRVTFSGEFILL